jgi:hypothetical protein
LGADSDELRSCGVNGTVGGYWWLLERASGDPYLWDDMTHDERAAGRDEHIRRRSEKFGDFDTLESDTRKGIKGLSRNLRESLARR